MVDYKEYPQANNSWNMPETYHNFQKDQLIQQSHYIKLFFFYHIKAALAKWNHYPLGLGAEWGPCLTSRQTQSNPFHLTMTKICISNTLLTKFLFLKEHFIVQEYLLYVQMEQITIKSASKTYPCRSRLELRLLDLDLDLLGDLDRDRRCLWWWEGLLLLLRRWRWSSFVILTKE